MYTNPKDVREKKIEKFGNTPMTWIVILIIIALIGLLAVPWYLNKMAYVNPLFTLAGVSEVSPMSPLTNTPGLVSG